MKQTNLDRFFSPRSVAVIGASTNPQKVGAIVLKNVFESGFGGMVSFELAGGTDAAKRVAKATRVFILGESLGGVESLCAWPPMMSHATMTEELRVARGIPGSLLRLSVGIEDSEDQLADLEHEIHAERVAPRAKRITPGRG